MRLTIDFETRSAAKLKTVGPWRYAEDPTTDVLCCAVKIDDEKPLVWVPSWVEEKLETLDAWEYSLLSLDELAELFSEASEIEAHNIGFEHAIWMFCARPKYGWPEVPVEKLRCSMAKCCTHSLPRGLDEAVQALGLNVRKDAEGSRVMRRMCAPKPVTKRNPGLRWNEEPQDFDALIRYCIQDVEVEHVLSNRLPGMPKLEKPLFVLDRRMNACGVRIDIAAAEAITREVGRYADFLVERSKEITGGITPRQRDKFKTWVEGQLGRSLQDLTKNTVVKLLRGDAPLPAAVGEALRIRQSVGRASVAKFKAMTARANGDGRFRGMLLYHGAGTGRWAGSNGVQVHNMFRSKFKDVHACIEAFQVGGYELVDFGWGDPLAAAASCIRGMIVPDPGHELIVADFSAIEARVLAWLAGEEDMLEVFRTGKDPYKQAASAIFPLTYDQIGDDSEERQIGKVAILALGYEGGIGAFTSMARAYGIDLEDLVGIVLPGASDEEIARAKRTAESFISRYSLEFEDDEEALSVEAAMACDIIKQRWRAGSPKTKTLWSSMEFAAKDAVRYPGEAFTAGPAHFRVKDEFLQMQLPSGRRLYYFRPRLFKKTTSWGQEKETLSYYSTDAITKKFIRTYTYSGKLTENLVQAVARDLLAEGMLCAEAGGYPVLFHVHDEIISQRRCGEGDVEEFCALMSKTPPWAAGCPVGAKGWRGPRYRK